MNSGAKHTLENQLQNQEENREVSKEKLSDEELARLVQEGEKETFGFLMDRYEPKLFRYGRKFLHNEDNIDDVVQEVFIKAYQNIKSFDVKQKFSPWIYRIAHNTYINMIKKRERGPMYLFDFDTLIAHPVYVDPDIEEKERELVKKMVGEALSKVGQKYKEILILYYVEELSYKEIAEVLHIPIGTVGIRIKRAKDALKKVYEEKEQGKEEKGNVF